MCLCGQSGKQRCHSRQLDEEHKNLLELPSRQLRTGSHCHPLPSMHFSSQTSFFILFSFFLPSKLSMCCVLTRHFSALNTKPSGAQCTEAGARSCASVSSVCYTFSCMHACEDWGMLYSPFSPIFPSSHGRITLTVISRPHGCGRKLSASEPQRTEKV